MRRGYVEGRGCGTSRGLDVPTTYGRRKGTSRGRGFDVKDVEGTSSFYAKYVKARAQRGARRKLLFTLGREGSAVAKLNPNARVASLESHASQDTSNRWCRSSDPTSFADFGKCEQMCM